MITYIDPEHVRPVRRLFLPRAFGKMELEAAAVLLVYYFQHVGRWGSLRLNEFVRWVQESARDESGTIASLALNPFWRWDKGFLLLEERGVLVREGCGEDVVVHITDEFILRCYLSSIGRSADQWRLYALVGGLISAYMDLA